MSSLRANKKEATRIALINAAVSLLVDDGPEALTVAAIAEKAGVSTRTFHNYFSSREEPLVARMVTLVEELNDGFLALPEDTPFLDGVEQVLIKSVERQQEGLNSFATLFRVSEFLRNTLGSICSTTLDTAQDRVIESAMSKSPGMSADAVSYTHLTLPTTCNLCRSRWSPYH